MIIWYQKNIDPASVPTPSRALATATYGEAAMAHAQTKPTVSESLDVIDLVNNKLSRALGVINALIGQHARS